MNEFIYCYKNLNTLYTDIRMNFYFLDAIFTNKNKIEEVIINDRFIREYNNITFSQGITKTLSAYLNILQSSFLDEYTNHFNCQKYSDNELSKRIQKIQNFNKPLLDIIENKWSDIKRFRNNCSAHNLRIKKNNKNYESIFQLENIIDYSIPYYFGEHKLFLDIIEIIISNIYFEFVNEINDLKHITGLNILDKINFTKNKINNADFEEIIKHKHYNF